LARLEREACNLFNVNTVVSERDAHFLRNQSPEAHIHLVENGVDTRYFSPCRHEEQPGSLIFTGSLNWHPNVNALRFFAREIWPLIKHQCSGAHLYLAGRSPHSSLLDWARRDPSVEVAASPDDIRPWIARACVFVCPILEGGGTRLKILDAMAMARPVVSTTIGCEGLRVTAGENILVADTPQDFASKVVNLLENSDRRRQLGAAGRTLVEKHYDWEIIAHQLHLAYRCALDPETCNLEIRNTVSEATASRRPEGS
jgi:glycosyltransferase involved in cell wall biosynthesis